MAENGAGFGFGALPPSTVGNTLLDAAAMNEQRNARRDSLRLQEARQKQEDDWRKFEYVKDQTDASKYLSGQSQIDNHSQSLLGQLMQQTLADPNFSNKSLAQVGYELNQKLSPIAQGDLAAKQMYERSLKQADDAAKKNPNIDVSALKSDVFNQVGQTFLDTDGNYRPIDQVDVNRDIVGIALSAPDAWKYSLGDAQLQKDLQNMQGDERSAFVGGTNSPITTYKGKMTPFQTMSLQPDAHGFVHGGIPQFNYVTDKVGGIEVLPEAQESYFTGDEARNLAYQSAWNKYKQANGITTANAQAEDLARRRFGLQYVKQNVKNGLYVSNIEHLPRYPSVTVKTGDSKKEVTINDVYGTLRDANKYHLDGTERNNQAAPLNEVKGDAANVVLDYARKLTGNSKLGVADIFTRNEPDGKVSILYSPAYTTENNLSRGSQIIGTVDYDAANLPANKTQKERQRVLNAEPNVTHTQQPVSHKKTIAGF